MVSHVPDRLLRRFDFADSVVVDGGAHKGYYAVRALERGGEPVYSYEPELSN